MDAQENTRKDKQRHSRFKAGLVNGCTGIETKRQGDNGDDRLGMRQTQM